jgi:RIO kinase 1
MVFYEDYDDFEGLPRIKNMSIDRSSRPWKSKPMAKGSSKDDQIAEQMDEIRKYNFTYEASRHERAWILDSLGIFHDLQWFTDIIRLVKGGKEATVYQCLASPESAVKGSYLAAKVYRPRRFRNLRKDHIYREGRSELDEEGILIFKEKMIKAIQQRSDYGREVMHASWLEHEFKTMKILQAAGADIPVPYASGNNAILMDFIGDEWGAAPTLNSVELGTSKARMMFDRIIFNVEILLANGRVHADLSAYNVLYWEGDIVLIDFPQAISPHENKSAFIIFERDMRRICEYFIGQGLNINYQELAQKLWQTYEYRQIPEFSLDNFDEESEADREYWNTYKE